MLIPRANVQIGRTNLHIEIVPRRGPRAIFHGPAFNVKSRAGNLALMRRTLIGAGTPRGLRDLAGAVIAAIRLLAALLDRCAPLIDCLRIQPSAPPRLAPFKHAA